MPNVQTKAVGLFTSDDDAILAQGFGTRPPESGNDRAGAIEWLRANEEPNQYSRSNEAFASRVLKRGED